MWNTTNCLSVRLNSPISSSFSFLFPHFLSNQTERASSIWIGSFTLILLHLIDSFNFLIIQILTGFNDAESSNIESAKAMSYRREHRSSKAALLDGLEEGGLRASSSYSSDISEHDNDKAVQSLQDRVFFLKRVSAVQDNLFTEQLTGDIHEEVESHNRMLDVMGNNMDASRGILSGTMDRFKMVFEKKSGRRMCALVGYFVVAFLIIYFLFRIRKYFMSS